MLPDLFYVIINTVTIVCSTVGFSLCFLTIAVVVTHRPLHNVTNLLSCNTCTIVGMYFIFVITNSIYGMRLDWQSQPVCLFRAYITLTCCAGLCYSYTIQAISRLFFAVFYKHRFLLTWRTHWILVIINWILSFTISIRPFFDREGFELYSDSRHCVVSPRIASVSIYGLVMVFFIPLNTVTIIYGVILYRVHRSGRRVGGGLPHAVPLTTNGQTIAPNVVTNATKIHVPGPNGKRGLKLMRNMSIQASIILLGGILYLVLVMWYAAGQTSPPEALHLLALLLIAIFTGFMMIALFLLNKAVKDIVFNYIFASFRVNVEQSMSNRRTELKN